MKIDSLVRTQYKTADAYSGVETIKPVFITDPAVVIEDEKAFIGILTRADLVKKRHNLIIDCLISKPFIETGKEIEEAFHLMKKENTDALPVTSENKFMGILCKDDLLDYLLSNSMPYGYLCVDQKPRACSTVEDNGFHAIIHDLKGPIGRARQLSAMLKGKVAEDGKQYLEYIEESCEHAEHLIRELLKIGQIESLSEEDRLQVTDINDFLTLHIASLQLCAERKGVKLTLCPSVEHCEATIHRERFFRALENIISNAIKFTRKGGVITISVQRNNNSILLKITDTGIGIPHSIQKEVFDKFTRSRRPGTEREPSSGLGLYITCKIIQQHQGRVWLDSEENKGTSVYVQLPASLG